MAIASVGTIGSAGVDTGGGNLVLTTSATVEANNYVVLIIAKDNAATVDGTTSEITGITDSAGNTYALLGARVNAGGGTAGVAAAVEIWGKRLSSQLNSGGTITIVKSTDVDAAVIGWEFTVGADLEMAAAQQDGEGGEPPALTFSGLSSAERLWLRAGAAESELTTAWTNTASYTDMGVKESSTAGSADSNVSIRGEFIIATATGHTSDPSGGPNVDAAHVMVALQEVAGGGGGGSTATNLLLLGCG